MDLLVDQPLTTESLMSLVELTRFETLTPRFSATVPPCWVEVQQEQQQRRHPQHLHQQHHGDAAQHTRTWKLQSYRYNIEIVIIFFHGTMVDADFMFVVLSDILLLGYKAKLPAFQQLCFILGHMFCQSCTCCKQSTIIVKQNKYKTKAIQYTCTNTLAIAGCWNDDV